MPTCRRPRPRRGPASVPIQDAVCCLRHVVSGSALPNTFRLIMCRGYCVHCSLRPAGLLPSLSRAFDTPLGSVGFLLPAGVCYRALRRLPGQDSHLLERRVFQDAPQPHYRVRVHGNAVLEGGFSAVSRRWSAGSEKFSGPVTTPRGPAWRLESRKIPAVTVRGKKRLVRSDPCRAQDAARINRKGREPGMESPRIIA